MPGFESMSAGVVAWLILVIALSGWVQGALGLGFPMLATPLIAAVTDMRTAVIVVLLPCLACVATNIVKTGSFRAVLARYWAMPFYMIAGAAVGTRVFIAFPQFPYTLLLAGMILFYLNLERLGRTEWPQVKAHPAPFGMLFGVLAGAVEGTANIAAPPLVIYYLALGATPATLVQGLNICFFSGKATQFATLATTGGVEIVQWVATLPLAVVACVAALYGIRVRARIDAMTYRLWLKRALFAIAVILCAQFAYAALFAPRG
jgi:uncharacterized membrane protein YfcA